MNSRMVSRGLTLLPVLLVAGCNTVVMHPAGYVGQQESHLITVSTLLMLIIIVPVMILICVFAWRYRKSNPATEADYAPHWNHSTRLELIIWGLPLLIIIVLGLITWVSTHKLDPYRPLSNISANQPIPPGTKPLEVDVVAMDWKWLFIYPQQGVATVNELVTPVNVPVHFRITASSFMNSFFIPALAGQIYAMPGMDTILNAVLNKPGVYSGISANYSGAGFSYMNFKYYGVNNTDFGNWVQRLKTGGGALDRTSYLTLAKPTINDPVRHYGAVTPGLYEVILEQCVAPGETCISQMREAGSHHTLIPGAYPYPAARTPAATGAPPAGGNAPPTHLNKGSPDGPH